MQPEPTSPPPLPSNAVGRATPRWLKAFLVAAASILVICLVLRGFNLLRPYKIPTGAMAPALNPQDHVLMEGLSYLWRKPERGELVVFSTRGIRGIPTREDTEFVKRVAGLSGERVKISNGRLFVDDSERALENGSGPITFLYPPGAAEMFAVAEGKEVTVPEDHYFVLGDNAINSADSRVWGFVPRENIQGRVVWCYWPPDRAGTVR